MVYKRFLGWPVLTNSRFGNWLAKTSSLCPCCFHRGRLEIHIWKGATDNVYFFCDSWCHYYWEKGEDMTYRLK